MPDCWRRRREEFSWRTKRWHAALNQIKLVGDDVQVFQTATHSDAIHF